ncbi:hypothetical protein DUI87_09500 [Hirundo rustica rustica]|uniref:Uncharacterized protein n=1 Tax=Hirundo rustica rustica TaxID=333673 RepID=A0A3M0KSQ2_HIRRU|nr:hypothetical protein DUI87_09500 [Hirundo rustica rustica]
MYPLVSGQAIVPSSVKDRNHGNKRIFRVKQFKSQVFSLPGFLACLYPAAGRAVLVQWQRPSKGETAAKLLYASKVKASPWPVLPELEYWEGVWG